MLLSIMLVVLLGLLVVAQLWTMKENEKLNEQIKMDELEKRTVEFIENRSKK